MSGVTVRFAGAGDAFGNGGRLQTCIVLRAEGEERLTLVDCGASSLVALKRLGIDPGAVDAIVLSHLHGDHFGGVPFFVLDAQFTRRERPLLVTGPPGTEERVRAAMEVFFPGSSTVQRRFELVFAEYARGSGRAGSAEITAGAFTVSAFEVVHASGAPAFALRLRCGEKVVAYSGDTEWTASLSDAARDADLFVCEAYSFERPTKFHLSHAALREHRAELGARRVILTHMGPEMLAHLGDVPEETAADGLTLTL